VEEAFIARRPAKRLLVVPQRRAALEKLVLHATSLRIPVVEVEGGSLTAIAGFDGHQGIALVVEPRVWASLDDVLARAKERGEPPFLLVLDSLEDPQNVGTLLRSAEAAGVHGAVFPTHRQAPLTPAAIKASARAVEHLALSPVDDLPGALADLRARGVRIVGADGDAPLAARTADLRGPLAIVVGSEGKGLSPAVRRRTDVLVRIPMHGRIGSLNAAVAGSVLLYEATAQRDPSGTGRTQLPTVATPRIDDDTEPSSEGAAAPEPTTAARTAAPKPARKPSTRRTAPATPDEPAAAAEPQPEPVADPAPEAKGRRVRSATRAELEPAKPASKPRAKRSTATKASARKAAPAAAAEDELLPGGPEPESPG
jgi:23S rRNA (guanosine2251-2'-O)-methyltransferase